MTTSSTTTVSASAQLIDDPPKENIRKVMFQPGELGLKWKGNEIVEIVKDSQAEGLKIGVGWIIQEVNGQDCGIDTRAILKAIHTTSLNGEITTMIFRPTVTQQSLSPVLSTRNMASKIQLTIRSKLRNVSLLDQTKLCTGEDTVFDVQLKVLHKIGRAKDVKTFSLVYPNTNDPIPFNTKLNALTKDQQLELWLIDIETPPKTRYCVISDRWGKGIKMKELNEEENPDEYIDQLSAAYSSVMFKTDDYGKHWSKYKSKGTGKINQIIAAQNDYLPRPTQDDHSNTTTTTTTTTTSINYESKRPASSTRKTSMKFIQGVTRSPIVRRRSLVGDRSPSQKKKTTQGALIEGYLMKKSPTAVLGKHVWQQRYFVMMSTSLLIYKKRSDVISKKRLDMISIENMRTVKKLTRKPKARFRFDLYLCESIPDHVYQFYIDDSTVGNLWVYFFEKNMGCQLEDAKEEKFDNAFSGKKKIWSPRRSGRKKKKRQRGVYGEKMSLTIAGLSPQSLYSFALSPMSPKNSNQRRNLHTTQALETKQKTDSQKNASDQKEEVPFRESQTIHRIAEIIKDALNFGQMQLEPKEIRAIVERMEIKKITKGTEVRSEEKTCNCFYFIDEGSFKQEVSDLKSGESESNIYKANDFFGELCLIQDDIARDTVTALEDSTCWILDRQTFKRYTVRQTEKKYRAYEDFLKGTDLLGKILEPKAFSKLAEAMELKVFSKNENIVVQGEVLDNFYVLKSGTCKSFKDGTEMYQYEKPGDCFGERSLLAEENSEMTITATSDIVRLLQLSKKDFELLLGKQDEVHRAIIEQTTINNSSIELKETVKENEQTKEAPAGSELQLQITVEAAETPQDDKGKDAVIKKKNTPREIGKFKTTDYNTVGRLGHGTFGTVELVRDEKTGETFALKCINKVNLVENDRIGFVDNERKTMAIIEHPFIVKLYGTSADQNFVYFLLEAVLGGELFYVLEEQGCLDLEPTKFYAASILLVFEYLHSKNVIYRDLKSENILIDVHGYIKLADFGFAKETTKRTYTFCGTPGYMAPEIVENSGHGIGVDWWTLGILIYDMLSAQTPFFDDERPQEENYKKLLSDDPIIYPDFFDDSTMSILDGFLERKRKRRLGVIKGGATLVKQHEWFKGFDFDALEAGTMEAPYPRPVDHDQDLRYFCFEDKESDDEYYYEEYDNSSGPILPDFG